MRDNKYLMDVLKSHCDVVDKVNMCCLERKSMLYHINKYRDALDIGTVGLGVYNAEIDNFWIDLKADVVLGIEHADSQTDDLADAPLVGDVKDAEDLMNIATWGGSIACD